MTFELSDHELSTIFCALDLAISHFYKKSQLGGEAQKTFDNLQDVRIALKKSAVVQISSQYDELLKRLSLLGIEAVQVEAYAKRRRKEKA